MTRQTRLSILFAAALAAGSTAATPAMAQAQWAPPPPPPPMQFPPVQAPSMSPGSSAMSALSLKLDALRNSVGRQIVGLHFPPTDLNSWLDKDNSFPANNQRAEAKCKSALGNRYGRVVSREAQPIGNGRWYFPNLLCETAP